MAASVRLDAEAFADARIALLGELLGYSQYEALGRLAHLWRYCTERGSYVVSPSIVDACLGAKGHEALVSAELGEWSTEPDAGRGIRVRGTYGRIEWLAKLRLSARAGGEANKRNWETKKQPNGYPDGYPIESHTDSRTKADGEPKPSPPTPTPTPTPTRSEIPYSPLKKIGRPRKPRLGEPTEAEQSIVRTVLAKLGARNGVQYAGSKAHTALIVGRLRDGYSEMDLRKVISYCAEQWSRKPEMLPYLRPETLFGPTTIARYVDAARAWFETLPKEPAQ